jgi:gamma-glutamylcyclotransferase
MDSGLATTFFYFAYGSNMFTPRLTGRTPSAVVLGSASICGYKLTFDKFSIDGSGKCDMEATGNVDDVTWGVLFCINATEITALDKAEGLGHGYRKESIRVCRADHEVSAFAYVATKKNPVLEPYHWYKNLVIAGCREHGLPDAYTAAIERVPSKPDVDKQRLDANEAMLRLATPAVVATPLIIL